MPEEELSEWQRETVSRVRRCPPERLVKEALNPRFTRYLEPASIEAWLERAEGFLTENPRLGQAMAVRAPELVGRAALSDPEIELRAWTVRGCMLNLLGELAQARQAFLRAAPLEHEVSSGCPELAALWEGYGLLESIQGRHTEALDLADRALSLLQSSSDQRVGSCDRLSVSCALVVKGTVLASAGASAEAEMTCFLEALRVGTERTPRSNRAAAHNLVVGLNKALMAGESIEVDVVLQWCGSLHRRLKRRGEPITSPARCRLHWVEAQALAWKGGGLTPQAEGYFEVAQGALLDQGAKQDAVLLNLDLGYWFWREGKWRKLEKLARETSHLASVAGYKSEELAALKQWCAAVAGRAGMAPAFHEVYRTVRGFPVATPTPSLPKSAASRWVSEVGW